MTTLCCPNCRPPRLCQQLEVIKQQYAEFEITGPPEVRELTAGTFNPHRRPDEARDKDEER